MTHADAIALLTDTLAKIHATDPLPGFRSHDFQGAYYNVASALSTAKSLESYRKALATQDMAVSMVRTTGMTLEHWSGKYGAERAVAAIMRKYKPVGGTGPLCIMATEAIEQAAQAFDVEA